MQEMTVETVAAKDIGAGTVANARSTLKLYKYKALL